MSNNREDIWQTTVGNRSTPVRIVKVLMGGPLDNQPVTCSRHFATVQMPHGDQLVLYERRIFVRAPVEEQGETVRQVAAFWCYPGTTDSILQALVAKRWP